MKAKDLAMKLLKTPDFDVDFAFSEIDSTDYGMTVRVFDEIEIGDIGYSSKIVRLGGKEKS